MTRHRVTAAVAMCTAAAAALAVLGEAGAEPSTTTSSSAHPSDGRGYLDSSARCDTDQVLMAYGRTARALVAICVDRDGDLEYRGVRLSDRRRSTLPAGRAPTGRSSPPTTASPTAVSSAAFLVSEGDTVLYRDPWMEFRRAALLMAEPVHARAASTTATSTTTTSTPTTSAPTTVTAPTVSTTTVTPHRPRRRRAADRECQFSQAAAAAGFAGPAGMRDHYGRPRPAPGVRLHRPRLNAERLPVEELAELRQHRPDLVERRNPSGWAVSTTAATGWSPNTKTSRRSHGAATCSPAWRRPRIPRYKDGTAGRAHRTRQVRPAQHGRPASHPSAQDHLARFHAARDRALREELRAARRCDRRGRRAQRLRRLRRAGLLRAAVAGHRRADGCAAGRAQETLRLVQPDGRRSWTRSSKPTTRSAPRSS